MSDGITHPNNQVLGKQGEAIAVQYLLKRKYAVIEQNFRCKCGELDIIAREGKVTVFIEVKTRKNLSYGPPQLAVTPFKQRQISKAALFYMAQKRIQGTNARFDVIAILLGYNDIPQIDHIINAFDLAY
jgi:putative endonuclease